MRALATCVIIGLVNTSYGQSPLLERFLDEMPREVRKVDARFVGKSFIYDANGTRTDLLNKRTTLTISTIIKSMPRASVYETRMNMTSPQVAVNETVRGLNKWYAFSLEQNRAKTGWLLTDIVAASDGRAGEVAGDRLDDIIRGTAAVGTDVGWFGNDGDLSKLPLRDGFAVDRIAAVGSFVEVTFRYTLSPNDFLGGGPVVTTMTFAPDLGWMPTKWTQSLRAKSVERTLSVSRDISRTDRGFSVRSVREERNAVGGPYHERYEADYRITAVDSVPDDEFRLTAYGLPEPPGFEPPPTPLYVWLLAAAGVCFALLVAFRALARRRAAA